MKNNKIMAVLKNIGLLILLLSFSGIVLMLLPIDYNSLSTNARLILLFVIDFIFLSLVVFAYFKPLKKDFKPFFKDFTNNIEISIKYWLIGVIVMIVSNMIIVVLLSGGVASNEESVRSLIEIAPLYMFFNVSIYAPLTEELIFRRGFREMISNKWLYIFMSGFTFGALHVVSSITSAFDLLYLIPYCSLGFAFAYTYTKTNNVYSTIVMHCIHNTMTIILYFIGSVV